MMWKWSDLKELVRKRKDYDVSELGAVMWPVQYPNPEESVGGTAYVPSEPHVTVVVFRGINEPNLGLTVDDVIDAVKTVSDGVMLWLSADGVEYFGPDGDVPVLRVSHDYLETFRDSLITVLNSKGIEIDNTYPEYKPHVTITELAAANSVYPADMLAGPVEVWWGDERHKVHVR